MRLPDTHKILFGGDYNPEQWPEDTWEADMALFHEAHVDEVTLNVFSWAMLQPSEDVYDFEKLDKIMDMAKRNGLKVIMATSTAATPAWMAKRYPETLKTDAEGRRRHFGGRQNFCPNSEVFRKYASRLTEKIAERYKDYSNIVAYHISNEYGTYCYCDTCTAKFRKWLKARYETLANVNAAWNTSFWSHTFYDWDEIVLPDLLSEEFHFGGADARIKSNFQGISLDYRRFMNESFLECFDMEKEQIKKYMPDIPVTTNLMGDFDQFDYREWAKHMDFVSWDNYPAYDQKEPNTSFWHDLMRGIGDGSSFSLMEQTPGISNWQQYCALKRPGVMRLWSYQAVAHGADTVLFFQMKRSIGACEKSHSALIDHVGSGNTRVFREMKELGSELDHIGDELLESRSDAKAAIMYDFENRWAVGLAAGPSCDIDYLDEIHTWYSSFFRKHIPVDIVSPDSDLSGYSLVIAPMLYMSSASTALRLVSFVGNGGTYITSYFSGYSDENDRIRTGGYPADYRKLLGIWVEESDALPPILENEVKDLIASCSDSTTESYARNFFEYNGRQHTCSILCDLLHTEGAETLSEYEKDFYAGMPVVTKNSFGSGTAYYVGTRSDDAFYDEFLGSVCGECGITPISVAPVGVEVTLRENEKGAYLFYLNHTGEEQHFKADYDMTDIITGRHYAGGEEIIMNVSDVIIGKK